MTTYFAEAMVPGIGMMQDFGLSPDQVERLREAERAGRISGLLVTEDIDLVSAFRGGALR